MKTRRLQVPYALSFARTLAGLALGSVAGCYLGPTQEAGEGTDATGDSRGAGAGSGRSTGEPNAGSSSTRGGVGGTTAGSGGGTDEGPATSAATRGGSSGGGATSGGGETSNDAGTSSGGMDDGGLLPPDETDGSGGASSTGGSSSSDPSTTQGCVASCEGRTCGDDGCGGSCGTCPDDLSCDDAGACGSICGNGELDRGETCDPKSSCPTSCDDQNACTTDRKSGSSASCDVRCEHEVVTACLDGDGCCAAGCNHNTDDDCSPSCGNGVIEDGETCDPSNTCPTSCDDKNACTTDSRTGSASSCSAACVHMSVTSCKNGDGCCPIGCSNANDNDCAPVSTQPDCHNPSTWPAAWVAFEDEVLRLVNQNRADGTDCPQSSQAAVASLTMDLDLQEAARCHSLDMEAHGYMGHTGSDGSDPATRIARAGYVGRTTGENVAAGYSTPPAVMSTQNGWMNSQGHCQNIMRGSFDEIGVGFVQGDGYTDDQGRKIGGYFWTQTFGGQ